MTPQVKIINKDLHDILGTVINKVLYDTAGTDY